MSSLANNYWGYDESRPLVAGLLPMRRSMSIAKALDHEADFAARPSRSIDKDNRALVLLAHTKERIDWDSYVKAEEDIRKMPRKLRDFYKKQNEKIENFKYVDSILDSSLPKNVIQSYGTAERGLSQAAEDGDESNQFIDDRAEQKAVSRAINVNFVANVVLLIGKIVVTISTNSLSIVASLLDSVLDFLSTVIVWTSNKLAQVRDKTKYPVGRSRLEPLGVLVFSVLMIVSFFQIAIQGVQKLLASPDTREVLKPLGYVNGVSSIEIY